MMLIA